MARKATKALEDQGYSKLDAYCIGLYEYYRSLRKAGFTVDNALWLISAKESYPDWINPLTQDDIKKHLEEEDE